jgi:uncharacterized protein YrzB (UPF0473 family)
MDEDKDILENENVVLVDEDGVEHTFVLLDVIEVDGGEYAILQPIDEDPTDDEEPEAMILKIVTDEKGEEVFADIEDDDEWEKVADFWQELMTSEGDGD